MKPPGRKPGGARPSARAALASSRTHPWRPTTPRSPAPSEPGGAAPTRSGLKKLGERLRAGKLTNENLTALAEYRALHLPLLLDVVDHLTTSETIKSFRCAC